MLYEVITDPEISALREQTAAWQKELINFSEKDLSAGNLHDLWRKLTPATPRTLKTALGQWLVKQLTRLPAPESIYTPPRFHIGTILLDLRRYLEAEQWLARALLHGIEDRARFLAWRGDALVQMGEYDRAKEAYLAAFLEGPDAA